MARLSNLPPDVDRWSFSGHETFPLRYSWLPKAIRLAAKHPDLFGREDAVVLLGVGKNMVSSIRHWAETLRLLGARPNGGVIVTPLGKALLGKKGWDPYLEDPGTLWLLHWLLVSRKDRASTWYLTFTQYGGDLFRAGDLQAWLGRQLPANHKKVSPATLKRDVDVFIRTYVPSSSQRRGPVAEDTFDSPLTELALIQEFESGVFRFVRGSRPQLPDEVLAFAIHEHWTRIAASQKTIKFESLLFRPGSPGASFKFSESAFAERLENLPRTCGLQLDSTAGARILVRSRPRREQDLLDMLARYYAKPVSQKRH